jgi:hypothetical protein
MARRKSDRELDREIRELESAERVIESGDVYSSLMPGSTDYEVVAKVVPASRASDVVKWSADDRAALGRVLSYARGHAANRGLTPVHPRLVASGDSSHGYVYHSLESRHANDPSVATFSSYDRARSATTIAEQTALDLGVMVPGRGDRGERRRH